MELDNKIDGLAKVVTDYKAENDKRIEEIKKAGFESAETKEKMEKMDNELDGLKETVEALHTAANRRGKYEGAEGSKLSDDQIKHKEAFNSFIRKGNDASLKGFESKEMSVIVAEDGGFLVPEEMSNEMVKRVFDTSIIRDLASVQTISSSSLEILEDLDQLESGWVAERDARGETGTPKLNKLIIPAHEIFAQPAATTKIIEDASINVESWLSEKAGEKMARDENAAFVLGDGEGKPRGFLDYPEGNGVFGTIETLSSGVSGAFAATPNGGDKFLDMVSTLKQVYRQNAYWGMNRKTAAVVRKFKSTDGQYIWEPSLQAGSPDRLVGIPMRDMDDMVAPVDFGAGSKAVVLGDFRAGYQIVDRRGVSMLRDPYTRKGFVLFYFTKRVGGAVKNYDAIKIMKLS